LHNIFNQDVNIVATLLYSIWVDHPLLSGTMEVLPMQHDTFKPLFATIVNIISIYCHFHQWLLEVEATTMKELWIWSIMWLVVVHAHLSSPNWCDHQVQIQQARYGFCSGRHLFWWVFICLLSLVHIAFNYFGAFCCVVCLVVCYDGAFKFLLPLDVVQATKLEWTL